MYQTKIKVQMWDEKKTTIYLLKKNWHFFQKFQNIATDYSPLFFSFSQNFTPKTKIPGPIFAFES
jgi:hypothetical protein